MATEEDYVMVIEVEVECKKCGTKKRVGIPVSCKPEVQVRGESLVCDLLGEAEEYLPNCECGKKEYEIKREKIKAVKKEKVKKEEEGKEEEHLHKKLKMYG